MTRIIVPYVPGMLREATVLALEQDRQNAEFWDVSATEHSYFDLLKVVWEQGEGFVLVEQDMVPYPTCIERMLDCDEPWCANEYLTCGYFQYGFGCTKFAGRFCQQYPDAFERMAAGVDFNSAHGDPRHYQHLDAQLALVLSALAGRAWPCRHNPPITHLNPEHFYPGGVRP